MTMHCVANHDHCLKCLVHPHVFCVIQNMKPNQGVTGKMPYMSVLKCVIEDVSDGCQVDTPYTLHTKSTCTSIVLQHANLCSW